jgi:DNA-binding MarR family transcriptional regulator
MAAEKGRSRVARFVPPVTISNPDLLARGSDDNFREAIYLFVKVLGRFIVCREAFGREIGLTGSQFAVLVGVAYCQGETGVTMKELSHHVHLASTHVTTEVGRLNRRKLVLKRSGRDDRRNILVSLTAEGQRTVRSVAPLVRRINDLLFSGISAAELLATQAVFTKLSVNSEIVIAELKRIERDRT